MRKNSFNLRSLVLMCIFALMIGFMLLSQPANAADGDSDTIYWAIAGNEHYYWLLVISDNELPSEIDGMPVTEHDSFAADTAFDENSVPWGNIASDISMVRIEGSPAPVHTDYWFAGSEYLGVANLYNLDLSKCESMTGMLKGCTQLRAISVGPGWSNLPADNSKRACFACNMTRVDIDPNKTYNEGAQVPEYSSSDAGMNIYVDPNKLNDDYYYIVTGKSLATFLSQVNAFPSIKDSEEWQSAVETAQTFYNYKLGNDMKNLIPAETLTAFQDAVAAHPEAVNGKLPRVIKIRWSSRDGEDLVEPISIDISDKGDLYMFQNFYLDNIDMIRKHFTEGIDQYNEYYQVYGGDPMGFCPISDFCDDPDEGNLMERSNIYNPQLKNLPSWSLYLTDYAEIYFYSFKKIRNVNFTVDPLVCGTQIDGPNPTELKYSAEDADKINDINEPLIGTWSQSQWNESDTIHGKVKGGQDYYINSGFTPAVGYTQYWTNINVNGKFIINGQLWFCAPVTAVHDLDAGTVTKAATTDEEGIMSYTCKACGETVTKPIPKLNPSDGGNPSADPGSDPNQNGSDGTPVGPGASAAAAERAITNMVSDSDPQGTVFGKIALKSPKQTKTSIDLSWNMVPGASSYIIYGNRCGKGIKPVRLAAVNGNKQTITMVNNQKVKKGTYYKFIMVALDKNNTVVSTSKVIHVATKGGKVGNHKKVTVSKSVIKKAKKLKKGKTLKLKAKAVPQSKKLKVRKHRAVLYESSNVNIATVSKKGVVKAKSKGTCYVYAYAQNGVFKKIKITVK